MAFKLAPITCDREGSELRVRGRVQSGAYFGPQPVRLTTADGQEYLAHVTSHEIELPEAWPVMPEHHSTVLVLHIAPLPTRTDIILVTGLGAVTPARGRLDVSEVLAAREFWALQLSVHFMSEDVDDPALEWLGVTPDAAEKWYETRIHQHIRNGLWPYVRVALPRTRYVELEMAGGVEPQDRLWIGDHSSGQRVLLGYHSGHFSLPALRLDEVRRLALESDSDMSNVLWLTTLYLQPGEYPLSFARDLIAKMPGMSPDKVETAAETLLANLAVEGLQWEQDDELGWINNWHYSQRNLNSLLSILEQRDFAYIKGFFS